MNECTAAGRMTTTKTMRSHAQTHFLSHTNFILKFLPNENVFPKKKNEYIIETENGNRFRRKLVNLQREKKYSISRSRCYANFHDERQAENAANKSCVTTLHRNLVFGQRNATTLASPQMQQIIRSADNSIQSACFPLGYSIRPFFASICLHSLGWKMVTTHG